MTGAEAALLSDWRAGKITTRVEMLVRHIGTIDDADELSGFIAEAKARGVYDGEVREAATRRQIKLGEKSRSG